MKDKRWFFIEPGNKRKYFRIYRCYGFAFNNRKLYMMNRDVLNFRCSGMMEKLERARLIVLIFVMIMTMVVRNIMFMMVTGALLVMMVRGEIMRQQYQIGSCKKQEYDASF